MTPETVNTFLRQYVASLAEESQRTKNGDRFGFDYLIGQLGAAEDWILHRAPSHQPSGSEELPQPKKEEEHGVDFAFLTRDRRTLIVFVLKDEKLTYRNFTEQNFDTDLRRAASQDLTTEELTGVTAVRIVLAYNKSEEEEGIEEFNRLAKSLGTKIGDRSTLSFERWNLDRLVDEIQSKLFTPALLPPNFFRAFTYLCAQVSDFSHGSGQWEEVLTPDWREFLERVLQDPVTPRSVWMVAVALPVIHRHGKNEAAFATGWIELLEWAMLALWDAALRAKRADVSCAVNEIWLLTYAGQLERFYRAHAPDLGIEDSLAINTGVGFEPAAQSYLAHWHLARLGLCWQCLAELEFQEDASAAQAARGMVLKEIATWTRSFLAANPGALRPLLDSNHIELFLVWSIFYGLGQTAEMVEWLGQLFHRLLLRRREGGAFRLIASDNNWESVFEMISEQKPPSRSFGRSSYLLLMLEEMCFALPDRDRDTLLTLLHEHVVLGHDNKGESLKYEEEVELVSWAPPSGWEKMFLTGGYDDADDSGVSITTGNFERYPNRPKGTIVERLLSFIRQTRERYPLKRETNLPLSVLLLACVKFRAPVPAEFWRSGIFGPLPNVAPEAKPEE